MFEGIISRDFVWRKRFNDSMFDLRIASFVALVRLLFVLGETCLFYLFPQKVLALREYYLS